MVNRWLTGPYDTAVALEAALVGSYEALAHLVFRGSRSPYVLTTSMRSVLCAWVVAHGEEFGGSLPTVPTCSFVKKYQTASFFWFLRSSSLGKIWVKEISDVTTDGQLN